MLSTFSNPAYLNARKQSLERSLGAEREYNNASNQLGSGGCNTDYSDVCDVELFVSQEVLQHEGERYEKGNNYNVQRLRSTSSHLCRLRDIASDFQQQISFARSNTGTPPSHIAQWAEGRLSQVEKLLNAKCGNESLFSGSATLTAAVGPLENVGVTANGVVTKDYFLGNQETISFAADSCTDINVKVNASKDGMAELIYGLNLCIYQANNPDALARANDLAVSATKNIINDNAEVCLQLQNVEKAQESLNAQKTGIEATIQKIGYKTPGEAFDNLINTLTLKEINQTLATKNDSLRTLMDIL